MQVPKNWRIILLGLSLSFLTNALIFFANKINFLKPVFQNYLSESKVQMTGTNGILVLASVVILQPVIEEYIFRYKIFNEINKNVSLKKSIIISSFIFALFHATSLLWFILAFGFAILACDIYKKNGIAASVGLHMGFNFLNLPIYHINSNDFLSEIANTYDIYIYLLFVLIGIALLINYIQGTSKK